MKKRTGKKGTILVENVIFVVLNLAFLSILVFFLYSKMSSVAVMEEMYAKEIALIIDAARPDMEISFNLAKAVEKAKDEDYTGKIVSINENVVRVQLSRDSGYEYSFFNDVDFDYLYYPHDEGDGNVFNFEVREK